MTNFFVLHKDGTAELYATVTDDSKRILHVNEEVFREQTDKNTQHYKKALEEIVARR